MDTHLERLLSRARGPLGPRIVLDLGHADGPLHELAGLLSTVNGFTVFDADIQFFRAAFARPRPRTAALERPGHLERLLPRPRGRTVLLRPGPVRPPVRGRRKPPRRRVRARNRRHPGPRQPARRLGGLAPRRPRRPRHALFRPRLARPQRAARPRSTAGPEPAVHLRRQLRRHQPRRGRLRDLHAHPRPPARIHPRSPRLSPGTAHARRTRPRRLPDRLRRTRRLRRLRQLLRSGRPGPPRPSAPSASAPPAG
ncbi:hypothetical protein SAMN05421854_103177 [Amycolatopsis rubida]|uniref:Uncharacterized protein n=1 Tax=Amycolatopsis rubida TaxID=112413 RepID=A0A1I5KG63_9PSEU|nr:hypothetical protein SAMN05421854_103177 [Amycolatopsis rubida]